LLRTIKQNARANDSNNSIRLIACECNIYTMHNAKMVTRIQENITDVIR